MPDKELENLAADDVPLEHLLDLQTHAGFHAYQAWIDRQVERLRAGLEDLNLERSGTQSVRGGLIAYRTCRNGLQIMIEERRQELQEREQS